MEMKERQRFKKEMVNNIECKTEAKINKNRKVYDGFNNYLAEEFWWSDDGVGLITVGCQ